MADVVMSQNGRPLSLCVECGQTDDHPKHQVFYGAELGHVARHFDCCPPLECADHAAAGGHPTCSDVLEASGGKRGLELAEHIINGGA